MAARLGLLVIGDLRGGRNGIESPFVLAEDQCAECLNVDFYDGLLGRRRRGAQNASLAFASFTTTIVTLLRHTPDALPLNAELWGIDGTGVTARRRLGSWLGIGLGGLPDTPTDFDQIYGVSFNGKFFLAYHSSVDSLHVWDRTRVRRTGFLGAPPPAPTVSAAPGTGITATRYYKVTFVEVSATTGFVIRRSDYSPVASLAIANQGGWLIAINGSPSGGGETHWELYGSTGANGPWYLEGTVALPAGSAGDTTPPASFPLPAWPLAAASGSYTDLPSAKFLIVDEARLLLAGSWMNPSYDSRVWWTPILNDVSTVNNDEHLNGSLNPYIDLDPGNGGAITGMGGPIYDSVYVFKLNQIYKLVRTGLSQAPYRPVTISKRLGSIDQHAIVVAEDESGNDTLYFLSQRGPYRLGQNGLQYCGRDIEDLWSKVNLTARMHGVWYPTLHQIWWWVCTTGSGQYPDTKLVFDVRRGQFVQTEGVRKGWVLHTGPSASAACSVMYVEDVPTPQILKPWIGQVPSPVAAVLWQCDTGALDGTLPYTASILTRAIALSGTVGKHGGLLEGHALGYASDADGYVQLSTIRDFGIEQRDASVIRFPMRTVGGVTRYILELRDLAVVSSACVQIRIGDDPTHVAAGPGQWVLDHLAIRTRLEEDR